MGNFNKRQYTFYYSTGLGLNDDPVLYDVFSSLLDSILNADSFLEKFRKFYETDTEAKEILMENQNEKD